MSTCDAIRCVAEKGPGKFLCSRHWKMVPLPTQQTIVERYRAGRRDFAFLSDVVYLKACVDAINGIAQREGKEGTNA